MIAARRTGDVRDPLISATANYPRGCGRDSLHRAHDTRISTVNVVEEDFCGDDDELQLQRESN